MPEEWPETFRVSGNILEVLGTFYRVQKISRVSENIGNVSKISRVSINFPKCAETFQIVWKLSRVFRNFLWCPEAFLSAKKLSKFGIFSHILNFPMLKFWITKTFHKAMLGFLGCVSDSGSPHKDHNLRKYAILFVHYY